MDVVGHHGVAASKSHSSSGGGRSASVISNEDLVAIAASPLAPVVAAVDMAAPPGDRPSPTMTAATNNKDKEAPAAAAMGRRHHNGAGRKRAPSLSLTLVGTSASQLSIQTASPASICSDRINSNSNGPASNVEEQQTCSGPPKLERLRRQCCSVQMRKMVCGLLVTAAMASSWVGATHYIKRAYLYRREVAISPNVTLDRLTVPLINATFGDIYDRGSASATRNIKTAIYYAPFFTTWFCTTWISIIFPLYLCLRAVFTRNKSSFKVIYKEGVRNFRERGFTMSKFFLRSGILCSIWVCANYMYIQSLRILDATDVMSLFATSVSFVYLLSWVILHEQFVGVRIVAVILCSTGIALLAYQDHQQTKTPTLGGVLLGATASAGSAIFRVLFKKLIGPANFNQVALFFTVISMFNTIFLWPIALLLYLTGIEVIKSPMIPWFELLAGAGLSLATNLLGNFGIAVTYEVFVTLGLIIAVPLSAAVDIEYNHVTFVEMKLSGNILIACGFMLVLFPNNWPDLLTKLIRLQRHHHVEEPLGQDACGGRSRLRSANGLIR